MEPSLPVPGQLPAGVLGQLVLGHPRQHRRPAGGEARRPHQHYPRMEGGAGVHRHLWTEAWRLSSRERDRDRVVGKFKDGNTGTNADLFGDESRLHTEDDGVVLLTAGSEEERGREGNENKQEKPSEQEGFSTV